MKKTIAIILVLITVLSFAGCSKAKQTVKVSVLSGPTGIGVLNMWEKSEKGEGEQNYEFTLCGSNDEIVAAVSNGQTDIALVATNLAATLYNKTNGGIKVLCVNTGSVLGLLSNGSEINSIEDIRGKTVFLPGEGANPEYTIEHILAENGIEVGVDVKLNFVSDVNELPGVWAAQENKEALILAPEPMATVILSKYENAKYLLNIGDEWSKIDTDSSLLMGCVIARKEFVENNPQTVKTFLREYAESINTGLSDIEKTAKLCEEKGIIAKAEIAEKAIPKCKIMYMNNEEMKQNLSGYLEVMYKANPKSVGGKLPGDDFYYEENG